MNGGFKHAFMITAYAFVCGLLLSLFALIDGLFRFAFSLGALFLGIRFFRDFETMGSRIWFIALSIFFYFVLTIIITMVLYAQGKLVLPDAS